MTLLSDMDVHPDPLDWREVAGDDRDAAAGSRPRNRMRWLLAFYAAALVLVIGRAAQLELAHGPDFREIARAPIENLETVDAERGRILDRYGEVLALDYQARALAVHYRYLQSPLDPQWLRRQARLRLPRAKRRDPAAIAAAEAQLCDEIAALHARLAAACGISGAEWHKRAARIESRVERLAAVVNRRRKELFSERTVTVAEDEPLTLQTVLTGLFAPPAALPPSDITVAEQASYHRIVDRLPSEIVRQIETSPAAFPGVRVVSYTRRRYPEHSLAANLIGHVSAPSAAQVTQVASESGVTHVQQVGLVGVEKQFEPQLAGAAGVVRRVSNRRGELLGTKNERRARTGGDVILTIDAELQAAAEQLLERFDLRQEAEANSEIPHGGALLVMDVYSGEMLAAASQPRFDPNWFATGDPRLEAALSDPGRPMFDRALRMELPPGSVFKPLVAMALLEHGIVREDTTFRCQGYLSSPDRLRCQIFREHGIGHGEITLAGALAQSCNVYFFHHASELGAEPLVAWARRFGFGEQGGNLPLPAELRSDEELQALAIGQGTLTATPLQVLRMYAAIANGGELVAPKFTRAQVAATRQPIPSRDTKPSEVRIAGLDDDTIAAVRRGLEAVVADPAGTAYATVRTPDIPIAGKTGTAQAGGERPDHAWFAGYVPADEPRFAFVVVLEHGGRGSAAAGTISRHLVEQLQRLEYLGRISTASQTFPPGKG